MHDIGGYYAECNEPGNRYFIVSIICGIKKKKNRTHEDVESSRNRKR